MTKGTVKPGALPSNVKRVSDGVIVARMYKNADPSKTGDFVYGVLSADGSNITDFDHFYRADGSRFDLGIPCKVTRQYMFVTDDEEVPTPPPPEPEPEPTPEPSTAELIVTFKDKDGAILGVYAGTVTLSKMG